jgi:hypothetical protein
MFGLKVAHRPKNGSFPSSTRFPRRRPRSFDPYAEGGTEPPLEDLLKDPVTEAIMRRDGVSSSSLRSLIIAARESLRSRESVA